MLRKLNSEFFGTATLLMAIVGSGIMGETLSQGNLAIALLANSIATGAALYVLIIALGPISGAHLNPAVSLVELLSSRLKLREFVFYSIAQITGAVIGVLTAHLMFDKNLISLSTHDRGYFRFYFSEFIATFGLITAIILTSKKNPKALPSVVSLYIVGAYWFTSSTSFANPAVTIARSLTNTFSGILWTGTPYFIAAQLLAALVCFQFFIGSNRS